MKKRMLILICQGIIGSLFIFSACGRETETKYGPNAFKLNQFNFTLEKKSREQLDYNQDGELEDVPFSLEVAEQRELIAVTEDDTITAYGMSPGTTYQEILLDIEGTCYETGLEWHTDYGDASMVRADYDKDGFCETAFVYPYGVTGGTGIYHDGLLVIDQDENGMVFWHDIFSSDMWIGDEIDERINDLLDWRIDGEQKMVYVQDASTGEEIMKLPYDDTEFGDATIRGVFFTGYVKYVLKNDEIYMECSPAFSFEDRVTPYYLGKILLKVLYQDNGVVNLEIVNELYS